MNSASAIICYRDKILLFHRDNKPKVFPDHWQLSGGGIEKGETPLQGLKRELVEEVSYIPKNISFLAKVRRKDGITYIYTSFVDREEAKRFKIGKTEGQEIGFFSINEALKLKLTPTLRKYLLTYKNQINQALKTKNFSKINL